MAIACLRDVTFFPLRPLFNSPCFLSCMAFSTLSWDFFEYLAINLFFTIQLTLYQFLCLARFHHFHYLPRPIHLVVVENRLPEYLVW